MCFLRKKYPLAVPVTHTIYDFYENTRFLRSIGDFSDTNGDFKEFIGDFPCSIGDISRGIGDFQCAIVLMWKASL